jgi:hypothetical protein
MMNIVKGYKKRLDSIEQIVSPTRVKDVWDCTKQELVEIILSGLNGNRKDGRQLTPQDLTKEMLLEIAMGRHTKYDHP